MEFLTSIVGSIGGEVAKYTLAPIGRQIGSLIFYNGNINNLKNVLKKLDDRKTTVDQLVDAAERNLRIPATETKTWQHNVDVLNRLATKFLEEEIKRNRKCLNDLCPNPKSRYSISRKAKKMKQEILVLLDEAEKYNQIDLPAPPPALGSTFNNEDTKEFESRNSIMNKILEALKDDSLSMISICGQGGVGKTTMVEKLVQIVESQKLFDEVAMAVVSQNPDVKRIQGDIASCLGLIFQGENEQERAQKLHERIIVKSGKKILLILDDVWTEEDYKRLWLPAAGKRAGYKILLTSRREDECQKMRSLNFCVDALSIEEGWNLFKGIAFAENSVDNRDNLLQMAKQIADECDGLPIAIVTIAKALKGRDLHTWADALNQLRRNNIKGISGMDKVYSRLELSYDLLQHEEAKACFLLCCLFPEDYAIRIEDLVRYAVGLRLLDNVETILEARNRVYKLIGELKESSLLLHGNKDVDEYVTMHDVFRDVAITIASREKSYLVSCDNKMNYWPDKLWIDRYNDCTALSLWSEKIKEHPTHLECPKLQLLQLGYSGSLPDNLFEGMKELKVVVLKGCFLPKSFSVIKKVRTLHISNMESTSTFGELKNVEILKIGTSRNLLELPNEVGLMENLRLLDMRYSSNIIYIPAGVLSKLSKLEELYVSPCFWNWESRKDGERMNASLKELESQPITSLEIHVSNLSHLPKRSIFELLVNFTIFAGLYRKLSQTSWNALTLNGDASEIIRSGICVLFKRAEYLVLDMVKNLKNGMYELGDYCFPELKILVISLCYEIEQLVDVKKVKVKCFRMLRKIIINSCTKLKYIFPMIMTTRLSLSLESISIQRCENMEGIFIGNEEGADVELSNLKKIYLSDLPNLRALWIQKSNDHQEVKSNRIELPNSILFPSSWIVTSNLKVLKLKSCHSLKVVFSTSIAEKLLHLETLRIWDCKQVEYIVGGQQGKTNKTLIFPMLSKVSFMQLPELESFCVHDSIFLDWRSLRDIDVRHCPKIQSIFGAIQSPSTSDRKQMLFKIPSEYKALLKEDEEEAKGITEITEFSQLKSVTLKDMENMKCFYGGIYAMEFPLLEYLEFARCRSMKTFSHGSSLRTPKLESICVDGRKIYRIKDLNTTVREEMIITLSLYMVQHLVQISLHPLSDEETREIRRIKIKECNDLLNVIPCNLIGQLQKVEILYVDKCDLVEEIFEYGGVNMDKGNFAISCHLQHIILENLKHLKHVFNKIPATVIVFQKLKMVSIDSCNNLKNIFSASMVRGLLQFEQLKVSRCDELEEIVAEENEEEKTVSDKIVLPQFRSVDVSHTSKLKCFYSGTCALEFPLLERLSLDRCYNTTTFSNGSMSTPMLHQLRINKKSYPCTGNLNQDLKNENGKKEVVEEKKQLPSSPRGLPSWHF